MNTINYVFLLILYCSQLKCVKLKADRGNLGFKMKDAEKLFDDLDVIFENIKKDILKIYSVN